MRLLLAFSIAPLATGMILFMTSLLTGKLSEGVWAFGVSALVAYPIVLIVGVPLYFVFKWLEWTSLVHYLSAGIALSFVPILLLIVLPKISSSHADRQFEIYDANIWQSVILLVATLATVACFWVIARPDRV